MFMRNTSQLRILSKAPAGWRICNLGAVIENTQYGTSNASGEDGEIPVIGMKNIQDGRVTLNNLEKTHLSETEYQSLLLRRGDILINRTNSYELVGKTGIYDSDVPAVFASYLVRLKPDLNQVNPKYLNYWLNSPQIKKVIKKIATKAISQANINPTELQKFCPLLLPPLSHQDKIVSLLQEIDTVTQKSERLIEVKRKNYTTSLHTLLNKAKVQNQLMPLSNFLKESKLPDTDGGPHKRITVRLWLKGLEKREVRGTEADGATVYYKRKKGQLIYGKQNAHRGAFGIIPDHLEGYSSSQDLPAFDISGIDPEWLYFCIANDPFLTKLENYTNGSGSKRLHQSDLLRLKIPVPETTIQVKSSQLLNNLRSEIKLLERQLKLYKKEKNTILTKLLGTNIKRKEGPND